MRIVRVAFLLFLMFGFLPMQAQSFKFLATGVSIKVKDEKGNWSAWSDLKPENITINFDEGKSRFVIYSQAIQIYKIVEFEPKEEGDTDIVYPFACTDDNGIPITISIITRKKQNNRRQLYITSRDLIIAYNIVNYPSTPAKAAEKPTKKK